MADDEDDVDYDEDDVEDESISSPTGDFGVFTVLVSFVRQVFCICSVALLPFHYPLFIYLWDLFEPKDDEEEQFFIRVTWYLIRFMGGSTFMGVIYSFLGAIFMQLVGRKYIIVFCNVSYLFLAVVAYYYYKKHNIGLLLAILHHVVNVVSVLIFFIYITEIASVSLRAFFLGSSYITYVVGDIMMEKYLLDRWNIRPLFYNAMIIAGCTSILSIFVPESPFWLASKNKLEAAEQTFFWIKAGSSKTSDLAELDSLLDMARERAEEGTVKKVFSRTFIVCWTFSILLSICGVHACDVQRFVIHDSYFSPEYSPENEDLAYRYYTVFDADDNRYPQILYGCLAFLVISFVIPRKILFFISFILGALLIVPILMKYANAGSLARISLYCYFISSAGTIPLIYIIPTELFPATSREYGIAASFSFIHFLSDMADLYSETPYWYLGESNGIRRKIIYFDYAVSIVGIPYLMYFMPETKGRTAYDFREVNLFPVDDEDVGEELEEV